jgi:glycosyltransferase involved in cell wall biosynthesis
MSDHAPLRVLIDLTQVPLGRMGVGSYAENLLRQLQQVGQEVSLIAVLQSDDVALRAALPARALTIAVPAGVFRNFAARLLLEQLYLPWLARRYGAGVIHSLHYSLPLLPTRARRVVTMHDMTAFLLPAMHTRAKGAYMRFFIRQAVRHADHLIFVSASALQDCRRWFHQELQNATVVHHGKSEAFHPEVDPSEQRQVAQRYGLPENYLLYLGTLEPRKNVPMLLRAFAALQHGHAEARLIVAGKKGWQFEEIFRTLRALQLEEFVSFPGYIEEADKPALMRGACIFIYPSLHEGFGVPVLEAMACGVPTIAGNRTSVPEIAGDGALLIDPGSQQQLTAALEHLYTSASARATLRICGLAQAAKFSWRQTAEETVAVYRAAAATGPA